jgi:hypothetical protein
MISEEYAEQYAVNLPEETKLNEILSAYQLWQDAVKKLFQVGSLKTGVTLETLQRLIQECDDLQVDLETESKQIRSIATEASDWIQSFVDVLEGLQIPITSIIPERPSPLALPLAPLSESETTEIQVTSHELIEKVTDIGYGDLKTLIDGAYHLTVRFPELMSV